MGVVLYEVKKKSSWFLALINYNLKLCGGMEMKICVQMCDH